MKCNPKNNKKKTQRFSSILNVLPKVKRISMSQSYYTTTAQFKHLTETNVN